MQLAITGIMDDDAANMISGSASAILLTPEGLSSIQTADLSGNWQYVVRFSLLTNVGSSIADIQQQNGISDAQITQNEELLSMLGQLPGSNILSTLILQIMQCQLTVRYMKHICNMLQW